MSVEHIFHCDGPGCECHIRTQAPEPRTFLTVVENPGFAHEPEGRWHFCGWDCVLKHGATVEPEEVIEP